MWNRREYAPAIIAIEARGRNADSAGRERAWQLEAVGVGFLAAAWLAGMTLGQ